MSSTHNLRTAFVALAVAGILSTPIAQAETWGVTTRIYAWVPEISQQAPLTLPDGEFVVPKSKVLDTLDMAFMGNIELRKDRWVLLADVVYSDNSDKRRNTFDLGLGNGIATVNARARANLKNWTFNVGVGYNVFENHGSFADVVIGTRYVDTKTTLAFDATFSPIDYPLAERRAVISTDSLDGIVGVRGEWALSDTWFVPYHLDAGAGDSDFTVQTNVGVGYRFGASAVTASYRYLRFDQDVTVDGQNATDKLTYQGPAVGFNYSF